MSLTIKVIEFDLNLNGQLDYDTNKRAACELWLAEHIGLRWRDWDWVWFGGMGFIMLYCYTEENATAFKLKFGL